MGQHTSLQNTVWRSGGDRVWLSMLVDTMQAMAREDVRATPCDARLLATVGQHLANPASPYPHWNARQASNFSFRN